jgi:hypothetical protein
MRIVRFLTSTSPQEKNTMYCGTYTFRASFSKPDDLAVCASPPLLLLRTVPSTPKLVPVVLELVSFVLKPVPSVLSVFFMLSVVSAPPSHACLSSTTLHRGLLLTALSNGANLDLLDDGDSEQLLGRWSVESAEGLAKFDAALMADSWLRLRPGR